MNLHQSRSLKRSLIDGWRIFALNWRAYLAYHLLYALVGGLGLALVLETLVRYVSQRLLPAMYLKEVAAPAEAVRTVATPEWPQLVALVGFAVAALVALYLAQGRLAVQMQRYDAEEALPAAKVRVLMTADRCRTLKAARRVFAVDAPAVVVLALFAAGIAYLATKFGPWWLLLFVPVYAVWNLMWHVARTAYAVGGEKYRSAFTAAIRNNARRSGTLFVVQFVAGCAQLLMALVALLPFVIYVLSVCAASTSQMASDVAAVPAWLPALQVALNTLAFAFLLVMTGVVRWAFVMKMKK